MNSHLATLWQLMRGHRGRYLGALGCLLVATVINYLVPLIGAAAIDQAIAGKPLAEAPWLIRTMLKLLGGPTELRENLWLAPIAMVLLTGIGGFASYLKGWQASLASDGIARGLKNRLYDHLNHLPARYHDQADTGDLVQRCTSDVETTRMFLATQIMEIGQAVILAATALPLLLSLSPPMTGVSFALILPIILYGYLYFRQVKHRFLAVDEAEGALTGVVQENLTGIRVVRAFARQDHEIAKFAVPNAQYRDQSLRMMRILAWYWSISDFVALSQIGLTLLIGAHWISTGTLTVGMLFAFLSYLTIMLWPVRQMGRILTDLGKTFVALTRIREILDVAPEPDTNAPTTASGSNSSVPWQPTAGHLRISGVSFAHGHQEQGTLHDISLEVLPGQTLAIVGPSGAGKSTLIHLLLRLYDYQTGRIEIDGKEIREPPRKAVRGGIGTVLQEPFLFAKTLRENISLGVAEAQDHTIETAARIAAIHDTINGFDEGYDTPIGERGITLSGGQKQRVAIARAILRDPPILVLDDALSAVDAETESLIINALSQRHGRATTLVIAHRLSTLVHADQVIVLESGRITQRGTHAELIVQPGLYQRLWAIQTELATEFASERAPNTKENSA